MPEINYSVPRDLKVFFNVWVENAILDSRTHVRSDSKHGKTPSRTEKFRFELG